jgi:predicted nucleic acid-binding protein
VIDVVFDANVVLKWFVDEGDEQTAAGRALLQGHRDGLVVAHVLDLTPYELGNALIRGPARVSAAQVGVVLEELGALCRVATPAAEEWRAAAGLAERHGLTIYDAAYAAVASGRDASLATTDGELLRAGLGELPSAVAARVRATE